MKPESRHWLSDLLLLMKGDFHQVKSTLMFFFLLLVVCSVYQEHCWWNHNNVNNYIFGQTWKIHTNFPSQLSRLILKFSARKQISGIRFSALLFAWIGFPLINVNSRGCIYMLYNAAKLSIPLCDVQKANPLSEIKGFICNSLYEYILKMIKWFAKMQLPVKSFKPATFLLYYDKTINQVV